jgi:hypothetical protein
MNAETASRLFDPFFTTRAEGTGLGLSIARGVARAHGGGIEVVSSPGAGAEFTLPCHVRIPEHSGRRRRRRLRDALLITLEAAGHRVIAATADRRRW